MVIRPATPADRPAYLELVRALARFEGLQPPDREAQERLLRDAFADPPCYELWIAAEDSGRPLAYAAFFMTYSTFLAKPTLYLEDLFVHPDARRRGVASAVLDRLRDLARERGCGRLECLVLDWNQDAQAFYRRVGAEVKPDWRLVRWSL